MTRVQRIYNIIVGIVAIFLAVSLLVSGKNGAVQIMALLGVGLIVVGIRKMFYYFSMAKYMVGGKLSLYEGTLITCFGMFTISVLDAIPSTYAFIYLVAVHGFAGLVELLRAFEAKEYGNKRWKMKMMHGIVDLVMAALCIILIRNLAIVVYVYCIGLIYSSILRIISAFSKTTIVYIQ
jgi:uncharacterized membrane protein HdeD (DUF308 family)